MYSGRRLSGLALGLAVWDSGIEVVVVGLRLGVVEVVVVVIVVIKLAELLLVTAAGRAEVLLCTTVSLISRKNRAWHAALVIPTQLVTPSHAQAGMHAFQFAVRSAALAHAIRALRSIGNVAMVRCISSSSSASCKTSAIEQDIEYMNQYEIQ